jgi:hypothetical protein
LEPVPLGIAQKGAREAGGVLGREWLMVRPDGGERTEAPPCRWVGRGKMDVGAIVFATELKVLIDVIEDLMG